MMLRSVAGERARSSARERLSEPTGSPVSTWSWMRLRRTSRRRSSRAVAGIVPRELYPVQSIWARWSLPLKSM